MLRCTSLPHTQVGLHYMTMPCTTLHGTESSCTKRLGCLDHWRCALKRRRHAMREPSRLDLCLRAVSPLCGRRWCRLVRCVLRWLDAAAARPRRRHLAWPQGGPTSGSAPPATQHGALLSAQLDGRTGVSPAMRASTSHGPATAPRHNHETQTYTARAISDAIVGTDSAQSHGQDGEG